MECLRGFIGGIYQKTNDIGPAKGEMLWDVREENLREGEGHWLIVHIIL